jgi:hypothetical protein
MECRMLGYAAYRELKGASLHPCRKMREVQGADFLRCCVRYILERHLPGSTFELETMEKVFR